MARKSLLVSLVVMLMASLVLLPSCSKKQQPAGPAGAKEKVIGVSLLVTTHDFYKDLQAGLEQAAKEKGFKLLVQSGEKDVNKQITQMQNFVTQKVDAIIVCPADTKSIGAGVEEANKAGIPVFTADIRAAGGKIVSHIASDNVMGGQKAGEYLVKLLGSKPEVQIGIINDPQASSVQERVKGFRKVVDAQKNFKVVSDLNGQGLRDMAMKKAADLLQPQPKLDAIFAINDDSAIGALTAVKEAGRNNIVIIGYDATPPAVENICADTQLKADVVQNPIEIGKQTIYAIADKLAGKEVKPEYPIAVGIVDKAELTKQGRCKK
jgi:ribose transport system substrate-binding protein